MREIFESIPSHDNYLNLLDAYRQIVQRVPTSMLNQGETSLDLIIELAKLRLTIASLGRLFQDLSIIIMSNDGDAPKEKQA